MTPLPSLRPTRRPGKARSLRGLLEPLPRRPEGSPDPGQGLRLRAILNLSQTRTLLSREPTFPTLLTDAKRVRGIGRGKPKDTAQLPASIPFIWSYAPKGKSQDHRSIRKRAQGRLRLSPTTLPTLHTWPGWKAKLEVKQRPSSLPPSRTTFRSSFPQEDPQEDSEIDVLTGEIRSLKTTPTQFSFQALSILEDHQRFAQEVLKLQSDTWDRTKVESNPSLFYHAYFSGSTKAPRSSTKRKLLDPAV